MALPAKKGLALVIGVGKPKDHEDEEKDEEYSDEDGGSVDDAYHPAVEEMAAALGVKPDRVDVPKFIDAFKLMHKLCAEHDEPDGDEE